jgi:chemotaxis protein methyltransferase CheR
MKKKTDTPIAADTLINKINADELWNVAWTYIKTVVDTVREPFLALDEELRVLSANKTFYLTFLTDPQKTEGELVYRLGNNQWDIPKLRILLEDILPKNSYFEDFKVTHNFLKIGYRVMILNARRVYTTGISKPIILLAMEDITKQVKLEDQIKEYSKMLTLAVAKRTAVLEKRVKHLEKSNELAKNHTNKLSDLKKQLDKLKTSLKR